MAETWRVRRDLRVLVLRHALRETSATQAGLPWPETMGDVAGDDPWLARLGPREVLVAGCDSQALAGLAASFTAGAQAELLVVDLSEALQVRECSAPDAAQRLARCIDADALPASPRRATRCRLGDTAVVLLRPDARRWWLLAEPALSGYIEDWIET